MKIVWCGNRIISMNDDEVLSLLDELRAIPVEYMHDNICNLGNALATMEEDIKEAKPIA